MMQTPADFLAAWCAIAILSAAAVLAAAALLDKMRGWGRRPS
jgi:hypothetical protein